MSGPELCPHTDLPPEDCLMCSGDYCALCSGIWRADGKECDHDTYERHGEPY